MAEMVVDWTGVDMLPRLDFIRDLHAPAPFAGAPHAAAPYPMDDYPPRQLSDKAKGKQRAVEPDEAGRTSNEGPAVPELRSLTVRFTEGVEDLVLSVSPKDTVRELKKKIRLERPAVHNRRLRLIHSGRLLTDGTFIYGWLKSLEEHQRRAHGTTLESGGDGDQGTSTWLHCSIGMEMQEDEEEDTSQPKAQLTPLRGFDRLVSAGFTDDDIATIRRQFRTSRGLDNSSGTIDEDEDEHARALEEQWIDNLDAQDGAFDQSLDATPDGLYTTLLQGVCTGFFFGLLPFFFMRATRPATFFSDEYEQLDAVPSAVYSKRMQMALVIGLLVNILLGILKWAY